MMVIRVNDPVDKEFKTGNYYDYYAFYAPSVVTDPSYTWSSNTKYATVNKKGVATAKKAGKRKS